MNKPTDNNNRSHVEICYPVFDIMLGRRAIKFTAESDGVSLEEVRRDIQEAIDIGWNSPDPAVKANWSVLFPAGKPNPEKFVGVISRFFLEKDRSNSLNDLTNTNEQMDI